MPWEIHLGKREQTIGRMLWPLSICCILAGSSILFAIVLGYWASTDPMGLRLVPTNIVQLLAISALLLGFAFLFHKPQAGLLVLVALVYSNASEIAVRYHGMPSALQALAILLFLVILGRLLQRSWERMSGDIIIVLSALYALVLFSSSSSATNPELADEKLIEYVKCLLIFALVMNLIRSRVTLNRAVWTILIVGAVLSTISAYQVITSSYAWDFGGFGRIENAQIVGNLRQSRISGALSDPNFYAQILVPLIPLWLFRLFDETSIRSKLFSAYGLITCLIALVFTYSRGAILALGVVTGLVLLVRKPRLKHCLAGVVLLGAAMLLVPPQFQQRIGTLDQFVAENESPFMDMDSSFQQRALFMRVAWNMWREHPFLGVGAGNYSEHYQEYADRIGATVSSYEEFNKKRFAHCLYLEIASETGLIGLFLFAAIIAAAGMKGWQAVRIFKRTGDFKTARLVLALLIGLAGYLTTSLFLHGHYLRHFWLLLALIGVSGQIAKSIENGPELGATE